MCLYGFVRSSWVGSGRTSLLAPVCQNFEVKDKRSVWTCLWVSCVNLPSMLLLRSVAGRLLFWKSWGLDQVEASVLLPQPLPLPGLHQAVDHRSQRVPVHAEAPPTAALHEAGPLVPITHEEGPNLEEETRQSFTLTPLPGAELPTFPCRSLTPFTWMSPLSCRRKPCSTKMQLVASGTWRRWRWWRWWLHKLLPQTGALTWILPLTPVLSIRLAMFTVAPQMSYCGLVAPITPAITGPWATPAGQRENCMKIWNDFKLLIFRKK